MIPRRDYYRLVRSIRRRLRLTYCAAGCFLFAGVFAAIAGRWYGAVFWFGDAVIMAIVGWLTVRQLNDAIEGAEMERRFDEWFDRQGWNN